MTTRLLSPVVDNSFTDESAATNVDPWQPAMMIGALLFVPAALPFLLNASSFMIGTMLVSVVTIGCYLLGFLPRVRSEVFSEAMLIVGVITAFCFVHLTINYMFRPVALVRALGAIPIIGIFSITVPIAANAIFSRSEASIDRAVVWVLGIFLLSGLLSLIPFQPPGYYGEKPTFPFTEPSFFAFTICPVLIYFCCTRSFLLRWLAIGALMALAVSVSNLTALAASLIVMLTFARVWQIGAAVAVGYLVWPYVDQDYFLDRLTLSTDTSNITSLVYVQGWQLLDEAIRTTSGWGLGIQQLGAGYTNTLASYRINQIMGSDVNLLDGGFLLSKLGSEFGVLGLLLIAVLTIRAGFSLLTLRALAFRRVELPRSVALAHASIVGSMVEVYLRGSTYFTGTMLLLCASVFFLRHAGRAQRLGRPLR